MKNLGKGWLIIEQNYHEGTRQLISILNPRKTNSYIREYMEQVCVDRCASFREKILYKKDKSNWPLRVQKTPFDSRIMYCGHDPLFTAIYCTKLKLNGETLTYTFKKYRSGGDVLSPLFDDVVSTIDVT